MPAPVTTNAPAMIKSLFFVISLRVVIFSLASDMHELVYQRG